MLTVYWIMFGLGVSFTLVSALLSGDSGHTADAAADGHAFDAPAADAPAIEAPAMDAPALDAPAMEAPAMDAPAMEAPAAEVPAVAAHAEVAPHAPDHALGPRVDLRAAVEHVHNALGPALTASSPLSISVFCAAFGGFGLIWTKTFGALFVAAGALASLALAVGTAAAALAFFNRVFASVQSDSTVLLGHLAGVDATVTLDVPENGLGTVSYEAGGRRHSSPARALSGRAFRKGSQVSIMRADQGVLFVDLPLDPRRALDPPEAS